VKRRSFSKKAALAAISTPVLLNVAAIQPNKNSKEEMRKVPLGLDAHSLSSMKWKAGPLIDYAINCRMESILFNGFHYFESLEDDYLMSLRRILEDNNMKFYFGVGGLSINSPSFTDKYGTPEELIRTGLRVAKIFKAKSINCKIGNIADRYSDGGISARMEELMNELLEMKSEIQDAGVKFAVENHAGDMRSDEVLEIVQAVGTDICGVMLDPGNSVWAMENPMQQIEQLGKHALCTSVRDYKIWESEEGATFQWTALGYGSMDFQQYTQRMAELCPGVPLHIETVSNRHNAIPFLKEEFWKGYPNLKAKDLLDFYTMIRNGSPMEIQMPAHGADADKFQQSLQKSELHKSIEFLREHCELIEANG